MARYAILSDLHSNIEAFYEVLTDIDSLPEKVDDIYTLGDLVVYGPAPVDMVETLEKEGILKNCVQGNNDYAIANGVTAMDSSAILAETLAGNGSSITGEKAGSSVETRVRRGAIMASHLFTRNEMEKFPEDLERLKNLPQRKSLPRQAGVLVHASPCDYRGLAGNYLRTPGDAEEAFLAPLFEQEEMQVCFFGHTHLPTVFIQPDPGVEFESVIRLSPKDGDRVEIPLASGKSLRVHSAVKGTQDLKLSLAGKQRFLINPGSVGQPRNGELVACYAVYDTSGFVEFHRIPYDLLKLKQQFEDIRQKLRDAAESETSKWMKDPSFFGRAADILFERFETGAW